MLHYFANARKLDSYLMNNISLLKLMKKQGKERGNITLIVWGAEVNRFANEFYVRELKNCQGGRWINLQDPQDY